MYFCFNCGHSQDSHRKIISITGHIRYVDCIQPIGNKKRFMVNVCQCSEFKSKEEITENEIQRG